MIFHLLLLDCRISVLCLIISAKRVKFASIQLFEMNKFIAIAGFIALALGANARSAKDFFVSSDASQAIPMLSNNTRLDMVDYFESGLPHTSANDMGGEARITKIDPENVHFEITSETPCQLTMLTAQSDTVLMVIETVMLPQADSHISFYDKNWNELHRNAFTEPKLADWLTTAGAAERDEVERWLPFMLWQADYNAGVLTLTNTLNKYYVSPDDITNLEKWIRPQLTYTYRGKKFVQNK